MNARGSPVNARGPGRPGKSYVLKNCVLNKLRITKIILFAFSVVPAFYKFPTSAINTIQNCVLVFVQTLSIWFDFKFAKVGAGEGVPTCSNLRS